MAIHERQAIRDAIVAALVSQTSAGTRVSKSRREPVRSVELPAISVYVESEKTNEKTFLTAPVELERILTVSIDAWVSADGKEADRLEDTLDAIALQVETAMDVDTNLSGTAYWSALAATELGTLAAAEGRRPMGCAHLEYTVVYHSDARVADAQGLRPDFDTADFKIAVAPGMADADKAEDLLQNIHE